MAKQNTPPPEPKGFTPDFAVGGTASVTALPTCEPNGLWLYSHHRSRWVVLDGMLVPDLMQIPLAGGIGGVASSATRDQAGNIRTVYDLTMLRANREVRGHVVIERGGPAGEYIRGHQVRGGYVYLDQHATPIPGLPQLRWDRAGYAKWARSLVDRGVVAPPDPVVLDSLIAAQTREHAAATDRALARPSEKVTADKIARNLDVLRAERAKLEVA